MGALPVCPDPFRGICRRPHAGPRTLRWSARIDDQRPVRSWASTTELSGLHPCSRRWVRSNAVAARAQAGNTFCCGPARSRRRLAAPGTEARCRMGTRGKGTGSQSSGGPALLTRVDRHCTVTSWRRAAGRRDPRAALRLERVDYHSSARPARRSQWAFGPTSGEREEAVAALLGGEPVASRTRAQRASRCVV